MGMPMAPVRPKSSLAVTALSSKPQIQRVKLNPGPPLSAEMPRYEVKDPGVFKIEQYRLLQIGAGISQHKYWNMTQDSVKVYDMWLLRTATEMTAVQNYINVAVDVNLRIVKKFKVIK